MALDSKRLAELQAQLSAQGATWQVGRYLHSLFGQVSGRCLSETAAHGR